MLTRAEIEEGAALVHAVMPPTPQRVWPLLSEAAGAEVWVKHENHAPTGAFKVRGGVTFAHWLRAAHPDARGIATATRGNHGQSQARAMTAAGLRAVVVVPHGNSVEKNAAMRAFGAELIEHGADFDVAREEAARIAEAEGLVMVPPFHRELVRGVASYGLELMTAAPDLDAIYVPVGCGSGICSLIAVRDALGLRTEIVGVVSERADAVRRAFESGDMGGTDSASTFADGMAVRLVVPEAFEVYSQGASRIVAVSDAEVAEAIRLMWRTTHNAAEGAGAAPLAGLMQERERMAGKRAAVILCGGNIDTDVLVTVLSGGVPEVA